MHKIALTRPGRQARLRKWRNMENLEVYLPQIHRPRKGGSDWYVFYSVEHPETHEMIRYRITEGFSTSKANNESEKNAQRLKRKFERRLRNGWTPFHDKIIGEVENKLAYNGSSEGKKRGKLTATYYMNKFVNQKEDRLAKKTIQSYQAKLRTFEKWLFDNNLHKVDISLITESDANEFVKYLTTKKKLKGKTKNDYIFLLQGIWKWIKKERKRLENIWQEIDKFKEDTNPQKPLPPTVIDVVKREAEKSDPQLWLACKFIYYCFIRPNELRMLKIKDINLFEAKINLSAETTKSGKHRIVEIPKSFVMELIDEYNLHLYDPEDYLITINQVPGRKHTGRDYLSKRFNKLAKRLRIPKDYTLYCFKHTGAVKAIKNGAHIKDIQHQMGHHDISQTDAYLQSMLGYESDFFKESMPLI